MPSKIDARLAELGITLPDAPAPAANYVPFVRLGQHGLRLRPGQPRRRTASSSASSAPASSVAAGAAAAAHLRAGS